MPAKFNGFPTHEALFWSHVDCTGECWLWTGARNAQGYGLFRSDQKTKHAHRVAYEFVVGPIPDGFDLCHACDNPPCCNPAHLWPGTRQENIMDAVAKGRWYGRGGRPRGAYCVSGLHEMSGDNLYVSPKGHRYCRACKKSWFGSRQAGKE